MTSAYIRHFLFFLFFTLFGTLLLLYQSNPYPISSFFIQPQCPIYSTPLPPTTTPLEIEDIPQSLPNRFVSIGNHGEKIVGETFKPEVVKAVEHVDKIEGNSARSFKNEEVVFFTYASSNHFQEARGMIRGIRSVTNSTIFFYDLGLSKDEVTYLKKLCNVKVVQFNFTKYPDHVRNLFTYAFKPIIMGDAYIQYKAFWIVDASARFFNREKLLLFYQQIRNKELEPFLIEHKSGHAIEPYTHPHMYTYFPLPRPLRSAGVGEANTMFIVRSKLSREIIRWIMMCALTQECIAPKGSTVICKEHGGNTGCHRFDQSGINIIYCMLNQRRKLPCLSIATWTAGAFSPFSKVSRGDYYNGSLPVC